MTPKEKAVASKIAEVSLRINEVKRDIDRLPEVERARMRMYLREIALSLPVTDPLPLRQLYKMMGSDNNRSRKHETVVNRQIAMALGYVFSGESMARVGGVYRKHPATVVHALQRVGNIIETKEPITGTVTALFDRLYADHLTERQRLSPEDYKRVCIVQQRLKKYNWTIILMGKN